MNILRMIGTLGFSAVLLSACTTAPSETVNGDDGNGRTYRITCGGTFSSASECFERAGFICGNRGYTVVKETDIAPPPDAVFFPPSAHEAVIRCNAAGYTSGGDMGGMNAAPVSGVTTSHMQ